MTRASRNIASICVATIAWVTLVAEPASASNFGDFPSVMPYVVFTPFVCAFVGWMSSIERDEHGRADGVDRGRFVLVSLLAVPAWLGLCAVAFLMTL